jgi:hypothetical protein
VEKTRPHASEFKLYTGRRVHSIFCSRLRETASQPTFKTLVIIIASSSMKARAQIKLSIDGDTNLKMAQGASDLCFAINGEGIAYREFSCEYPQLEPLYTK